MALTIKVRYSSKDITDIISFNAYKPTYEEHTITISILQIKKLRH